VTLFLWKDDVSILFGMQEAIHVIHHPFAGIGGNIHDLSVHTNGIFGTGLHAKTAVNAFAEINVKTLGAFLNIRIGILFGHNVDASGRTHRLAHHAGHTAGTAVLPLSKPMARPIAMGIASFDLRIHDRDGSDDMAEKPQAMQPMKREIPEEMPGGDENTLDDLGKV